VGVGLDPDEVELGPLEHLLEVGVVEIVDHRVTDLGRVVRALLNAGLDVHQAERGEAVHAVSVGLGDSGPDAEALGRIDQCGTHVGLLRRLAFPEHQTPGNEQGDFLTITLVILAEHFDELWFLPPDLLE
jgi:hypothetical protein